MPNWFTVKQSYCKTNLGKEALVPKVILKVPDVSFCINCIICSDFIQKKTEKA